MNKSRKQYCVETEQRLIQWQEKIQELEVVGSMSGPEMREDQFACIKALNNIWYLIVELNKEMVELDTDEEVQLQQHRIHEQFEKMNELEEQYLPVLQTQER